MKIPYRQVVSTLAPIVIVAVVVVVGRSWPSDPEAAAKQTLDAAGVKWRVGEDYHLPWRPWKKFSHVTRVEAVNSNVTSAELAVLATLSELEWVVLIECPRLTSDVVHYLQDLPELDTLSLTGQHVDDSWLPAIAQLRQLKFLALSDSRVTDRGIKYLESLPYLSDLVVINTKITDEAFQAIATLDRLRELHVKDCNVTDQGLRLLHGRLSLVRIELSGTKVTPDGMLALLDAMPDLSLLLDRAQIASLEDRLLQEPTQGRYQQIGQRIIFSGTVEREEKAEQ